MQPRLKWRTGNYAVTVTDVRWWRNYFIGFRHNHTWRQLMLVNVSFIFKWAWVANSIHSDHSNNAEYTFGYFSAYISAKKRIKAWTQHVTKSLYSLSIHILTAAFVLGMDCFHSHIKYFTNENEPLLIVIKIFLAAFVIVLIYLSLINLYFSCSLSF